MKYLSVVLLAIGLTGCNWMFYEPSPLEVDADFESPEEIQYWIEQNIEYKNDSDGDYWQSPEETLNLRTGDCEDMAILFMYYSTVIFNIKPELVVYQYRIMGVYKYHAMPQYNRKLYDIKQVHSSNSENFPVFRNSFEYDRVMLCMLGKQGGRDGN